MPSSNMPSGQQLSFGWLWRGTLLFRKCRRTKTRETDYLADLTVIYAWLENSAWIWFQIIGFWKCVPRRGCHFSNQMPKRSSCFWKVTTILIAAFKFCLHQLSCFQWDNTIVGRRMFHGFQRGPVLHSSIFVPQRKWWAEGEPTVSLHSTLLLVAA